MSDELRVPFLDLAAQHAPLASGVHQAVDDLLRDSSFILGPAVERFEAAFADYCGTRHAIGVSSGTAALHLALLALGIEPGDEVITVPTTFVASVAAIEYCGARPVLVDVDPVHWTMDPDGLEAAITPRTRAIMPVHLHGQTADMRAISEIAERHGLPVIEDAAQAQGARHNNSMAGNLSAIAAFSFYPGKNLGAFGEAGAVTTNDDGLADKVRSLRSWGERHKSRHDLKGFNYRMDGFQGAVLDLKLAHLEAWTEARRTLARHFDRALDRAGVPHAVQAPGNRHVYHVYAVRLADRDRVAAELRKAGIASGIHYPHPVHLQPAYRDLGYGEDAFPVAEALAREFLSLPLFPTMSEAQMSLVLSTLEQIVGAKASVS